MANGLKAAEYLADTLAHKVSQLIGERNMLRKELAAHTDGILEQDKAFIGMFRNGVIDGALSGMKACRLEHLLLVR